MGGSARRKFRSGESFERRVLEIQQKLAPDTELFHDEKVSDIHGIERQFDVVMRGTFAGRPVLGVIECRDNSRRKGLDAVEAFAKKCESVGANLRLMVSRRGFTKNGTGRVWTQQSDE